MTFWQNTAYVLQHMWLWPLRLWMQPLSLRIDAKKNKRKWSELICALLGGAIWGAVSGIALWQWTGNIHAIWILAFAFSLPIMGSFSDVGNFVCAFGFSVAAPFAVAFSVIAPLAVALATPFAFALVVNYAAANTDAFTGPFPVTFNVYLLIAFFGILLNWWLPINILTLIIVLIAFLFFLFSCWAFVSVIKENVRFPNWAVRIWTILWVIGLLIIAFALFPDITKAESFVWGATLLFSFGIGSSMGFFITGLLVIEEKNLRGLTNRQLNYLSFFWIFFIILTLGAWLSDPDMEGLNENLDILALFLASAPLVMTGLFLYPFLIMISLWQCRRNCVRLHTAQRLNLLLPIRFQTFAYPLPGLCNYLIQLARYHDAHTAFEAIQTLQFWSLQMRATRLAAQELANDKETAIDFCGHIAIQTNAVTLFHVSTISQIALPIVVLSKYHKEEAEQPLQLYAGQPSSQKTMFLLDPQIESGWLEHEEVREQTLAERVAYALHLLVDFQSFKHYESYHRLLLTLQQYILVEQLSDFVNILSPVKVEMDKNTKWMAGGWQILKDMQAVIDDLDTYRELSTESARKDFLASKTQRLQALSWDDLPLFWGEIGKEVVAAWVKVFTQETNQAKEWLRLTITLPQQTLKVGQQNIILNLENPTNVLARKIVIKLEESAGIFWNALEARHRLLEGGQRVPLTLKMECKTAGEYSVKGVLKALDLEDNRIEEPFSFRIHVGQVGKPYAPAEIQPYEIGPGLGSDRTFVGRQELLDELQGLWRQPQGKPAVMLVGQRRIGKTSLLNKIVRDGLTDTHLIPIVIDIQNCSSDYDFFRTTARKMSQAVGGTAPVMNREDPYPDFKDYLLETGPRLQERRFLLMLDEADLIPQRQFSDLLPGFLRSLMQSPDYPTLLLFCGTYALKRMGQDYDSILFNTAKQYTVSYMKRQESHTILQKPVQGILEFDPLVLEEVYELTQGQPLVVQSIGAKLIQHFNRAYHNQEERDNYVDLNDLERAVEELVKQESNAAFENHWRDSDSTTRRVLSTLASVTDERSRKQLNMDGIEAAMGDHRISLPHEKIFSILEDLVNEEILVSEGPTYRFRVPLYRRWIHWRWSPAKVREESRS